MYEGIDVGSSRISRLLRLAKHSCLYFAAIGPAAHYLCAKLRVQSRTFLLKNQ